MSILRMHETERFDFQRVSNVTIAMQKVVDECFLSFEHLKSFWASLIFSFRRLFNTVIVTNNLHTAFEHSVIMENFPSFVN